MLEKFLAQLLAQAGLSPAQIVAAYQHVITWQAEIEAFKAGAAGMVAHYNARLDALAAQLDRIERAGQPAAPAEQPAAQPQPLNGKALP